MSKTAVKPTIEDIKGMLQTCRDIYSPLQSQFEEDEKFYELDFKSELHLPDEFVQEGIVLPTGRDLVDTCVDHTDIINARVFVNRKGTSAVSAAEVEMMRKFYLGLIYKTATENSISPFRVGDKHYWIHGMACFQTIWDADRWADKPTQDKGESENTYAERIDTWRADNHMSMPIIIRAVHPHNIMPDPFEGGGRFVFEVQTKLASDVMSKYPNWTNPEGKTYAKEVEHVSFWTKDYRCELYDGEPVLKTKDGIVKHNYGFLPYTIIDSGLGNVSYTADPCQRYVGTLRHIRDLLISESRNYSINDIVLKRTAWPWFTIEGDNAELVGKVSQEFGEGTRLPKGTKIVQQSPQLTPGALMQEMDLTASLMAAHSAPNSVRGLGESGVRSGNDRRQVIAEASTRYMYANEAFRMGLAKVLTNCALLMKNVVPGDVRVWSRTPTDEFDVEIKKDKMKEPFTCYLEFAPVSEEDEYRRHDDLERLVQGGIVTKNWARTQMSNVDPMAMLQEEEVEKALADPAVQMVISQYRAGKVMEALNKRSQAESLKNPPPPAELANGPAASPQGQGMAQPTQGGSLIPPEGLMPSGTGPRRMVPGLTNQPALGSAQAMQTQMGYMRSKVPMTQQGQGGGGNRP
jgi:hypothetical protein